MAEVRCESLSFRRPELFAGLSEPDCTEVLSSASFREYLYQDVIVWAGDRVKEVLLLVLGRVKVTQFTKDGLEVILRLNTPGEIVGVPSMDPRSTHGSTAQAMRACNVLVWDAAAFAEALLEFPILGRNVAAMVAQRIVEMENRFCELSTVRVAPRLALTVVRLLDQVGRHVNGHVEIDVSQEVLAQMTAMTTSTVSRLLGKWEEQGVVQVRRAGLVIHNVPGLQFLCRTGMGPLRATYGRSL